MKLEETQTRLSSLLLAKSRDLDFFLWENETMEGLGQEG